QHWDAAQFQGNDTALQQALSAFALNPFDLSQDVLVRGVLVSTSAEEWVFLLVVHHIVADGWSLGLLIREVAAVYQALLEMTTVESLPSRPLQYGDYVQWQRQWLQGDVLDAKLAYWRTQLANLPVEPVLPPDHPQAAVETAIAATHEFRWSPEIVRVLRDLSRQERVTLFMTLFGLLEVLLYRQTGQTDLPVGTDVANRFPAATEETIGFFVNVLVLRGDISGNPTFRNLLHRVRKMALEAYAHQDVPFDRVVAALNPDRQQQTPLFQLLFVLQNAPMPPLELPGVTLELLEFENPAVRFDIAFFATEIEEGLWWQWRYNAARFDTTTIDRLAQAFTALSEALVASPDATIAELIEAIAPQTTASPPRRGIKSLRHIQSKPVEIAAEHLTTVHPLFPDRLAPVVFAPALPGVELRDWAASHRPQVEAELARTGAVLFRGFGIDSAPAFEAVAATLCDRLYGEYGDLPRTDWGGKVYGSTPYPADRAILFHSESSHLERWPQKIAFCCLLPSQEGGETPLVDCQEILKHLPPDLRDRFADLGLLYIRNYIPGLDVSWQDFFRTDERHTVEAICRQRGIAWEWLPDGGLQTRQLRPAIACHPRTGALVFFNQIFLHHAACLEPSVRDSLLTLYGCEHRFPRSVCFGDGSPIPDAVVSELSEWYTAEQVSFPWQAGDILLVDNLRMAHGRGPYRGDRRIVVAMGDMMTADVAQPMGGES
ncbi:MAG TPA: condensation domain-containing protein, partial [Stenomitos sp.]